ncbi:MAG TPA: relaxase/mobilization nuclease domain-containing protein [Saprospiraceae bacterium]|nr:relaxase/mobilization nuclease domain-containing protein [Saprospiraceae bacterium]
MIVKSLSRKSKTWEQLLNYMMHDKDRYKDERGESFVLQRNVTGRTIKSWNKQFEKNETNRLYQRSNSVTMYHEILSWSNKDTKNMTIDKMKDMADKYMEIRSENSMFIAIPHQDKTHWHMHFCISGTQIETGLASRVSREEFKNIKKEIQQYQIEKYPELSNSIVNHDGTKKKEIINEKEYQLTKRTKQPSEKERTKELLTMIYKQSASKEDFYKRIQDKGLKIYERGGRTYGIEGDRKMRFSTLGFDDKKIDTLDTTIEFERLRNDVVEKTQENFLNDNDKHDSNDEEINLELDDDVPNK